MKTIIFAALILLSCAGFAQQTYTINGQLADPDVSGTVYLRYYANSRPRTDSAKVEHGKFSISGPLSSMTIANLEIGQRGPVKDIKSVYLEPGLILMASATPYIKDAVISGSAVNDDAALLDKLSKPLEDKVAALNAEWQRKTEKERADTSLFNQFNARSNAIGLEFNALRKQFAMDHPNSYMGLVAYGISRAIDFKSKLAQTEQDFNRFSPEVRATDMGKTLAGMIEGARNTNGGQLAMDFSQNDVSGKPVKLSDFRGKYVLLDFWASWCGPCRAESPVLVKAFNEYKDKNFNILSVALEKPGDRDSWIKAIKKDGMTWTNVSDFNYWQNDAAVKYGITTIPASFLIDPSGKVIARNLRGAALESKLAELLKK